MSTRSYIARQHEDGTINAVYVHSDGYLSGVGQQLIDWVGGVSPERRKFVVDKLMAEKIGWSAICDKNIDEEPGWVDWDSKAQPNYDEYMDSPEYKKLQSYTARGEQAGDPTVFPNLDAFRAYLAKDIWIEYTYLFSADYSILSVYSDATLLGEVSLTEYPRLSDEHIHAADLTEFIKE